jgi:hypothetical protein
MLWVGQYVRGRYRYLYTNPEGKALLEAFMLDEHFGHKLMVADSETVAGEYEDDPRPYEEAHDEEAV